VAMSSELPSNNARYFKIWRHGYLRGRGFERALWCCRGRDGMVGHFILARFWSSEPRMARRLRRVGVGQNLGASGRSGCSNLTISHHTGSVGLGNN
jgi:hypothetical protein